MTTVTPLTPPRVPIIDPKTGFIDRAWYMFFLSLNNAALVNNADVFPSYTDISGDFSNLYDQAQLASLSTQYPELFAALSEQSQNLSVAPTHTPQIDQKRYGSFYDLNSQTAAAINTAYAMTFSNTEYSLGVTRGSPTSRIYVDRPSIYNIQFSAQLDKTSASAANLWIWLDKNGSTVASTATQVTLQGSSAATVAAWNFLLEMNAGDYFRLMWSTDDTGCYIKYAAATAPVPAIPSIILTVTDNIK